MTCNDCEESGSYSTKTVSTPNKSEAPVSNYTKLGDGYVKITYVEEETDTTPDQEAEYDYTGGQQTFTAAKKGYYKLETWGASGGNFLSFAGGNGSYSTGYVSLDAGNKLYVNVGGQGTSTTQEQNDQTGKAGGYNGGGKSGNGFTSGSDKWSAGASGGGATHIATASGLLSSLSSNRSSILIVAGGGGGASKHSTAGNAGGFTGGSATSYGGATILGGTQTTGYAFGQGQSITNQKNSGNFGAEGNGGAGGGFFGGYAHNVNGEKSDAGGAGGSGYIGNTKLINKYMACYNCSTSNAEDTKTISSNRVSDRPITGYSKMGNGFVRITYIGDDITKIKSDNDNGLVAVTFDPDGGYVSTTEKQYMVGSKYENLPIPRKDGYTFKGWATSFDGYMNLDYIENDGATPIDTLYKPESDDVRYEFKFVPVGIIRKLSSFPSFLELKNIPLFWIIRGYPFSLESIL
jgi:hypothetical protein